MITMVMTTTISRIMILAMVTRITTIMTMITTIGHKDAPWDNRQLFLKFSRSPHVATRNRSKQIHATNAASVATIMDRNPA